jgi:hypothetical protein
MKGPQVLVQSPGSVARAEGDVEFSFAKYADQDPAS